MSRGVIYLVSGARSYVGELMTSLTSLRRHEPDLPVTVFTSLRLPRSARCEVHPFSSEHHPLKQKVLVLPQSPYDETLFLDTDTTVLGPLAPVFDHLGELDFAVGNTFLADRSTDPPKLLDLVKPGEYNTGVLLFNAAPATRRFLQRWEAAVLPQDPADMWAGHNCDQTYFNRLAAAGVPEECGLRFGTFPNTVWNVRGIMVDELKRRGAWPQVRVLHHRTRPMKTRKALYSVTDPATAREVARKARNRVGHLLGR